MNTRDQVFESLNNAVANDFDMVKLEAEQIALDLCTYDAALEVFEPEVLVPYVNDWLSWHALHRKGAVIMTIWAPMQVTKLDLKKEE